MVSPIEGVFFDIEFFVFKRGAAFVLFEEAVEVGEVVEAGGIADLGNGLVCIQKELACMANAKVD